MMLRTSRQVLTAGKADEVVADSGGPLPNHSVFTGHLIEALQGKAATPDGVLTASLVMSYVYSKVANDKNSNQTPHYGHIDGDGDMILLAPGLNELEASDTKDLDHLVSVPYADTTEEITSTSSKVKRVKALSWTDAGSIELHDLLTSEVRRFLSLTLKTPSLPPSSSRNSEFVSRLGRYEVAAADLALLLACVAHWGCRHTSPNTTKVHRTLRSDRLELTSGLNVWLALRWYPLLLELYCTGVAAVDARRYDSLAAVLNASYRAPSISGLPTPSWMLHPMLCWS